MSINVQTFPGDVEITSNLSVSGDKYVDPTQNLTIYKGNTSGVSSEIGYLDTSTLGDSTNTRIKVWVYSSSGMYFSFITYEVYFRPNAASNATITNFTRRGWGSFIPMVYRTNTEDLSDANSIIKVGYQGGTDQKTYWKVEIQKRSGGEAAFYVTNTGSPMVTTDLVQVTGDSFVLNSNVNINGDLFVDTAKSHVGVGTTNPAVHSGSIGTNANGSTMTIYNPTPGGELLRFATERSWVFKQRASGSGTSLEFQSEVDNKFLLFSNVNSDVKYSFRMSNNDNGSCIGIGTYNGTPQDGIVLFGNPKDIAFEDDTAVRRQTEAARDAYYTNLENSIHRRGDRNIFDGSLFTIEKTHEILFGFSDEYTQYPNDGQYYPTFNEIRFNLWDTTNSTTGTFTNVMTMRHNGVGIGTTDPGAKLLLLYKDGSNFKYTDFDQAVDTDITDPTILGATSYKPFDFYRLKGRYWSWGLANNDDGLFTLTHSSGGAPDPDIHTVFKNDGSMYVYNVRTNYITPETSDGLYMRNSTSTTNAVLPVLHVGATCTNTPASGFGSAITFGAARSYDASYQATTAKIEVYGTNLPSTSDTWTMDISTRNNDAWSKGITIDERGFVGINDRDPSTVALEVNGSAYATSAIKAEQYLQAITGYDRSNYDDYDAKTWLLSPGRIAVADTGAKAIIYGTGGNATIAARQIMTLDGGDLNVGIGTTDAGSYKLYVNGTAYLGNGSVIGNDSYIAGVKFDTFGSGAQKIIDLIQTEDDDSVIFRFRNQQSVLNRTTWAIVQADTEDQSDDRLKADEEYISDGLGVIMKLKPQRYQKAGDLPENHSSNVEVIPRTTEVGFIAQQIYYEVPELKHMVRPAGDANPVETMTFPEDPSVDPDYSSWGSEAATIRYIEIIPYNTAAIQDLKKLRDADIERISTLESQMANLTSRVESLEN
jgi:hypothetical protein